VPASPEPRSEATSCHTHTHTHTHTDVELLTESKSASSSRPIFFSTNGMTCGQHNSVSAAGGSVWIRADCVTGRKHADVPDCASSVTRSTAWERCDVTR
jgi:hypothetical protein